VRLRNPASMCTFTFAFMIFLFGPPRTAAAELTDTGIGEFRALIEEKKLAAHGKAGPLTNKETSMLRGFLDQFEDIKFGGYLDTYIQYESVNPDAGDSIAIPPLMFDRQVNSFTIKHIQLWLYKDAPEPGDIGFKISLDWGDMARRNTNNRPVYDDGLVAQPIGTAPVPGQTGGRQVTFSEAYVLWNIPLGKGLKAKFGKFPGWLGLEVWGSLWNPNYTASYTNSWGTFGNATGLALGYDVTSRLSAHYYFTNTTGTFVNNNKSFTHGVELNYILPDFAFFKSGWIHFGTIWGPEHALNNSQWTQRYDLTVSLSPFHKLTLVTDCNWVSDPIRTTQPSGRIKKDNHAWGVAQYFIYDYTARLEFVARGEYYWDQENVLGISGGDGASFAEVTGTVNIRLRENILIRPEIRYDKILSVPGGSSHIWHHQDKNITALIGVSYEF